MSTATDTLPAFPADFANEGTGFYCTVPLQWPNPWTANPNHKGSYPGDCWQHFDTYGDVESHRAEAHPVWYAEEVQYRHRKADRAAHPQPERPMPSVTVEEPEMPTGGGVPTGSRTDSAVTEKQLAFIASLAARKGIEANEVKTKAEASIEIDRLNAHPDKDNFRRNQYDGPCATCGVTVPAGEGMILKDGRWLTYHLSCPNEPQVAPEIPNGYYAISSKAGHTSFYSVTAGRNPGVIFVDLLIGGGSNGSFQKQSVPRKNQAAVLGEIEKAGVEAAAKRFGQETGKCCVCNRGLTNEESREAGIGPECSRKL